MDTPSHLMLLPLSLAIACSIDPSRHDPPDSARPAMTGDADRGTAPGATDATANKVDVVGHERARLLSVTTQGDVCLIDPADGSVLDRFAASATDVVASSTKPGIAYVATWDDDLGGALLELDTRHGVVEERAREASSSADTRLLFAGDFVIGLAVDLGTTLFVSGTGRVVAPPSDVIVRPADGYVQVTALQQGARNPGGVTYEVGPGSIREVATFETATGTYACGSRLLDADQKLFLVAIDGADLVVQSPFGKAPIRVANATQHDGCVEDTMWDPRTRSAYVLTGPEARLHEIDLASVRAPRSLTLPDVLWHDPLPRRRLASTTSDGLSWAALSERLVGWEGFDDEQLDGPLVTVDGCDAEAIALVRQ